MKKLILSLTTMMCFMASGTAQSADQGFTITGTVATGVAVASGLVTITGADGTALSQTATTGTDGSYSINFTINPSFPIQISTTVNGDTQTNIATDTASTTVNLNPVTTVATNSAINTAGGLSNVNQQSLTSAGQSLLDTALGGGVSYESFSSNSFTARTSATDFTQTASVADVFLDTLAERATTTGTTVSTLVSRQTTPLLEDDTFLINAAENLALIDTTETVSSVITGGTKAQAVNSVANTIRSVVSTVGTKDKAAISAARAVGAAIRNSISDSTSLTSATQVSNLASNVTQLVQSSVVSLVQSNSAASLSEADLVSLATTLGTNSGTALQSIDLTGSTFTETQVSTDLSALTTSLANIGTAVENIANTVVTTGTSVENAVAQNSAALNNATQTAQTTATTVTTVTTPTTTTAPTVTETPEPDVEPASPITP